MNGAVARFVCIHLCCVRMRIFFSCFFSCSLFCLFHFYFATLFCRFILLLCEVKWISNSSQWRFYCCCHSHSSLKQSAHVYLAIQSTCCWRRSQYTKCFDVCILLLLLLATTTASNARYLTFFYYLLIRARWGYNANKCVCIKRQTLNSYLIARMVLLVRPFAYPRNTAMTTIFLYCIVLYWTKQRVVEHVLMIFCTQHTIVR